MLIRSLLAGAASLFLGLIALRIFDASAVVGQPVGFLLAFLSLALFFYGVANAKGLAVRPNSVWLALVLLSAFLTTTALDNLLSLNYLNVQKQQVFVLSPLILFVSAGWWLAFRSPPNESAKLKARIMFGLVVSLGVFFATLHFLKSGAQ